MHEYKDLFDVVGHFGPLAAVGALIGCVIGWVANSKEDSEARKWYSIGGGVVGAFIGGGIAGALG
jgi:hypothetical protein